MGIAEMDFGVSDEIRDALLRCVQEGRLGYASSADQDELEDALQEYYFRCHNWDFSGSLIDYTSDISVSLGGFIDAFAPGDASVIVPTPSYSPLVSVPRTLGRRVVGVPLIASEARYALDLDAIELALKDGARAVLLCHPHNPTGTVFTRPELTRLAEMVDAAGAFVFSDELFGPLTFSEGTYTPYASASAAGASHSMTVVSASKAWNISGLRCAQLVISQQMRPRWTAVDRARKPPVGTPGVQSAAAAFRYGSSWLTAVRKHIAANAVHVADIVRDVQLLRLVPPQAAYFCWFSLSGSTTQLVDAHAHLSNHMGIETQGAQDFGGTIGSGFRMNIATSRSVVDTAAQRIAELFRDGNTRNEQGMQ